MNVRLPEDCAQQWQILLLLLSAEEKKIDRTADSEVDTMNYFLNHEGVKKIFTQWLEQMESMYSRKTSDDDTALKSDAVALHWRQRGNDKFRSNCIEEALQCYTKSVVYAEPNGQMYPLALANRSAVLLRMKQFKECLADVSRALAAGYPRAQRHKLLLRRADCLSALRRRVAARHALNAALRHATALDLSPSSSAEFQRHLKLLEKKLELGESRGAEGAGRASGSSSGTSVGAGRSSGSSSVGSAGPWGAADSSTSPLLVTSTEGGGAGTLSAVSSLPLDDDGDEERAEGEDGDDSGPDEEDELPGLLMGENDDFVAASSALDLKRSPGAVGRWVATRAAAKRGDVLFSEEPFAWVALPQPPGAPPLCETCCRPPLNPLPCTTCSRAVFCGSKCLARGVQLFHRWECAGARSRLFASIGIAHLALRVLLISASHGFPPPPPTPPSSPRGSAGADGAEVAEAAGASAGGACDGAAAALFAAYARADPVASYRRDAPAFLRMFQLVTNFDKMTSSDYTQYALTATLLTLYLDGTGFWGELDRSLPAGAFALAPSQTACAGAGAQAAVRAQRRLFAAALVLRALGQLVCNGHAAQALTTTVDRDAHSHKRTVSECEVRRATAIYPSAAMMNHSCDPNIINTFYHSRLIVRCARELTAGEEVANCYGPHRARQPAKERAELLRAQYMFACSCAACADDDNDRKDFAVVFSAFACASCRAAVCGVRARCAACRAPFDHERARALLDQADDLAAAAEASRSLEARCAQLHAALRTRAQALHKHHVRLRDDGDALARLYADLGEFGKSVELIKQNIQSLEYQFGSFSVEVAHELRKLSDVMLERMINAPQSPDYRNWCLEAHKVIKKAVQLMELNYGSWEPLVKRLKQQMALVASQLDQSRVSDSDSDSVHHSLHYNLKI